MCWEGDAILEAGDVFAWLGVVSLMQGVLFEELKSFLVASAWVLAIEVRFILLQDWIVKGTMQLLFWGQLFVIHSIFYQAARR